MATSVAYQATDLARNSRDVLDAAREGRALIRDKDGLALVMLPAADVARGDEIVEISVDLLRVARAVLDRDAHPSAVSYGGLGWLSVLPADAQRAFFLEMTEAVLVAASGLDFRHAEHVLGDWRATAESWADPDTRERLLADEDQPLENVVL